MNEKIQRMIINVRERSNLTMAEFGRMFAVSTRTVARWVKGECLPRSDVLLEIVFRFGLDMEEIIGVKTIKDLTEVVNNFLNA